MTKYISNKQPRRPLKKQFILVMAGLLIVVATITALENFSITDFFGRENTPENATESQYGNRSVNDVDYAPAKPSDNDEINAKKETSPGEQTPAASSINLTITRAFYNPEKQVMLVRTLVEGATTGTCELWLVKGGQVGYTKNTAVIPQGNIFTCDGYDISAADIPSGGTWNLKIRLQAANQTKEASQDVVVEK